MTKYNLNSDMAEGYGPWTMGDDDGLLQIVQSANIACGYHGGDHNIMARDGIRPSKWSFDWRASRVL